MFIVYEEYEDGGIGKIEGFEKKEKAEEFVKYLDKDGHWLKIEEIKPHDDFRKAYRLTFHVSNWKLSYRFEPVTYIDGVKLLPKLTTRKNYFLIEAIVKQGKLTEEQEKLFEKANEIKAMPNHKDSKRWIEIFNEFKFDHVCWNDTFECT